MLLELFFSSFGLQSYKDSCEVSGLTTNRLEHYFFTTFKLLWVPTKHGINDKGFTYTLNKMHKQFHGSQSPVSRRRCMRHLEVSEEYKRASSSHSVDAPQCWHISGPRGDSVPQGPLLCVCAVILFVYLPIFTYIYLLFNASTI